MVIKPYQLEHGYLKIYKAKIKNSYMGIVSKNSSKTEIHQLDSNAGICLYAYRDKLNYFGSIIKIKDKKKLTVIVKLKDINSLIDYN